jgi:hypothetical protein
MAGDEIGIPDRAEWEADPVKAGRKYVRTVAVELFGDDASRLEIGESPTGDFSLTGPTEMVDRLTEELARRRPTGPAAG